MNNSVSWHTLKKLFAYFSYLVPAGSFVPLAPDVSKMRLQRDRSIRHVVGYLAFLGSYCEYTAHFVNAPTGIGCGEFAEERVDFGRALPRGGHHGQLHQQCTEQFS